MLQKGILEANPDTLKIKDSNFRPNDQIVISVYKFVIEYNKIFNIN